MKGAWPLLLSLTTLAVALALVSLAVGPISLGPGEALAALLGRGEDWAVVVVQEIRLPRTLLALAIGATLGLGGAALQGYTANPLAEPALLGTASCAALGAVVVLYFGLASLHPLLMPAAAVAGAFVPALALLTLTRARLRTTTLILVGIAISSLASALISLAINLSPNPFATLEITFWLLGSLEDRSLEHVAVALPLMAAGAALLLYRKGDLDALVLGEDTASSLGIRLRRVQGRIVLGLSLGVGGAVAVAGSISFVGLVVPHLVRPLVGYMPGRVHLPAALAGASLLLAADIAVRLIPSQQPLRLGVLTAIIGVPFLIAIVLRRGARFG